MILSEGKIFWKRCRNEFSKQDMYLNHDTKSKNIIQVKSKVSNSIGYFLFFIVNLFEARQILKRHGNEILWFLGI